MPTVTLQRQHEQVRTTERTANAPQLQRSTRILLVEDEPLTAEVFARALLRDGHHVDVARDGLQAVRRLHDGPPSLVVLDMSLPALSGAEFIRRLRAAGHHRVPVVVVSGSSPVDSELQPTELEPGQWLNKPLKPKELVRAVRAFLGDAR
jgi:DNA-binding response OmpR family regulator